MVFGLPPEDVATIASAWQRSSGHLLPDTSQRERQMFTQVVCSQLPEHLEREVAETLLTAATRSGAIPAPLDPSTMAPTLVEIAAELAASPGPEKRERIATLHRVFFATRYPDREDFLMALMGHGS